MADFSFLDQVFREKQGNGPVYLVDIHRELESWQEEQLDCRRT